MSQDIGMTPNPRSGFGVCSFAGRSGGLVVPAGIEGQLAEELAGGGVDDADVQVADEDGLGRFFGSGVTNPARVRYRLIVAADAVRWWWWWRRHAGLTAGRPSWPALARPAGSPSSLLDSQF
jgi:hypothetical protein